MKLWCHCCGYFHSVFGEIMISIFGCIFVFVCCSVCSFCSASIIHFGSSLFLYQLLVVQDVKHWCHYCWCFCLVFGLFLILFCRSFCHCSVCLFCSASIICFRSLSILFVLVIGHSAHEMLALLFLVFSVGVWCVFNLVLLH